MKTSKEVEIGTNFEKWEVVGKEYKKVKTYYIPCKCECGTLKDVNKNMLVSGKTLKCLSCYARDRHYNYKPGDLFDKWEIVEEDVNSTAKQTKYICMCTCGEKYSVSASSLKQGKSTKCRKCDFYNRRVGTENLIWKKIQKGAVERKLEINVTWEYLKNLIINQNYKCKLSSLSINFADTWNEHHYEKKTTASLDRVDSTKGYIIGNVQWVHKHINFIKMNFPQDYFIELCKQVGNTQCWGNYDAS